MRTKPLIPALKPRPSISAAMNRRGFLYRLTNLAGATILSSQTPIIANAQSYPEKGMTFLFQGDSITDGNRGRNADPNHIMGHGYAFSVASRIGADFPTRELIFYNRGVSGNTITDLEKRWQQDTIALQPDVLSILVGINDAAASVEKRATGQTTEKFESVYRSLLQQATIAKPATLLVLGVPFVYPVGKRTDNWPAWRDETLARAEVVKKLAASFDAVLIDYPAVFDKAQKQMPVSYWIWDGIHPTVPGHELMAREWISQVRKRVGFLKHYK